MRYPTVQFWVHCYFLLYSNDLPLGTNIDSKLLLYADDTSVLTSGTAIHEAQTKSIIALDNINKLFALKYNNNKRNLIHIITALHISKFFISIHWHIKKYTNSLGQKPINTWFWECTLSLYYKTYILHGMSMDAWSIIAIKKNVRLHVLHITTHTWVTQGIFIRFLSYKAICKNDDGDNSQRHMQTTFYDFKNNDSPLTIYMVPD